MRGRDVGERVIWRRKDAEVIAVPEVACESFVLHEAFDETEVDPEMRQVGDDLLGILERQPGSSLGVAPTEFGEQIGQ